MIPRTPLFHPARSRLLRQRAAVVVVCLGGYILLPAGAVHAHSALQPSAVDAGKPVDFTLTILHGCAPGEPPPEPGETVEPTIAVSVRLPVGAQVHGADSPAGWDVTIELAEDRAVIDWNGGELGADDVGTFPFSATLYGSEGDALPLEVFQGCTEGAYRWTQVAADDDTQPLDQPAPVVELLTSANPDPTSATSTPTPAVSPAPASTPSPDPVASTSPPTTATEPSQEPMPRPTAVAPSGSPSEPAPTPSTSDGDTGAAVIAAVVVMGLGALSVAALRRGRGAQG